mgnify:CR=1 FL=1
MKGVLVNDIMPALSNITRADCAKLQSSIEQRGAHHRGESQGLDESDFWIGNRDRDDGEQPG